MFSAISAFLKGNDDTDKSMKGHLLFAANPGKVERPGELDQFTFLRGKKPALKGITPSKAIEN